MYENSILFILFYHQNPQELIKKIKSHLYHL
ncbi:DUF3627 domain-containing protein [Myroides odoratus]